MLSTMLMLRTWRRISRQTTTVNSRVRATLYRKLVGSSMGMNIICSHSTVRMTTWCMAAPLPRRKLAATQAAALSAAVTLLCLWIAGLGLALAEGMFPSELEMERFLWMYLGLWALLQLLAAICFLAGCAVPDSRLATGAGGGLCVLFLLLDMLAGMDEAWEALRFFTPLALYDPMALSEGTAHLWMVAALAGAALVFYGLGTVIFCRRDLSL